jgi:predicted MarR family transcription regulator
MKQRSGPKWHLGGSEMELAFAEFQHAAICYAESFYRYIGKSLSAIAEEADLSGYDSVILNTIHVLDRPKGVTEIQHFTNRSDAANIRQSVRKLMRAGLVEKAPRAARGETAYRVTARGRAVAQKFVAARRELLSQIPQEGGKLVARLGDSRNMLTMMTGLYDQASRVLATRG